MLLNDMKTLLVGISPIIYIGEMGEADNAICLYFSGGFAPNHGFEGRTFEQPTFQVRVRHKTTVTAIEWATAVKDALDGIGELTIDSTRYISVFQMGDLMPLGKDSKGRSEYTVNFQTKTQR